MRCSNIEINAKIPIPTVFGCNSANIARPLYYDGNGNAYAISAVKSACEEAGNIPIIRYDDNGNTRIIGIAKTIQWNPDGYIEVAGTFRYGGTSEEVILNYNKEVVSMTIQSIGLGVE